ncbi:hypothetical protein BC833DRAFT_575073, partial [Globomyces pollinis-pini]
MSLEKTITLISSISPNELKQFLDLLQTVVMKSLEEETNQFSITALTNKINSFINSSSDEEKLFAFSLLQKIASYGFLPLFETNLPSVFQTLLASLNKLDHHLELKDALINTLVRLISKSTFISGVQKQLTSLWIPKVWTTVVKMLENSQPLKVSNLQLLLMAYPNSVKPFKIQLIESLKKQISEQVSEELEIYEFIISICTITVNKSKDINTEYNVQELLLTTSNTLNHILDQLFSPEEKKGNAISNRFSLSKSSQPFMLLEEFRKYTTLTMSILHHSTELEFNPTTIIQWIEVVYTLDFTRKNIKNSLLLQSIVRELQLLADQTLKQLIVCGNHKINNFSYNIRQLIMKSMWDRKGKYRCSMYDLLIECLKNGMKGPEYQSVVQFIMEDLRQSEAYLLPVFTTKKRKHELLDSAEVEFKIDNPENLIIFNKSLIAFENCVPFLDKKTQLESFQIILHLILKSGMQVHQVIQPNSSSMVFSAFILPELFTTLSKILFHSSSIIDKSLFPIISKIFCKGLFHSDQKIRLISKEALMQMELVIHPKLPPQVPIQKNEQSTNLMVPLPFENSHNPDHHPVSIIRHTVKPVVESKPMVVELPETVVTETVHEKKPISVPAIVPPVWSMSIQDQTLLTSTEEAKLPLKDGLVSPKKTSSPVHLPVTAFPVHALSTKNTELKEKTTEVLAVLNDNDADDEDIEMPDINYNSDFGGPDSDSEDI